MAWDPIEENELAPGFSILKHVRQSWNCLKWLYGQIGTFASDGVLNGSFEVDSNADGVPDSWTLSTYPGGAGGVVTEDRTAGAAVPDGGNTGNGTVTGIAPGAQAITETWTLTCTASSANGGTFSVVGSVSGAKANATVGVAYDNGFLDFTINDGGTDFAQNDKFTIYVTGGDVPAHGASTLRLIHPGGAGNGGGYWSSDYIICSEYAPQALAFIHWATAAGMRNQVKARFFDQAKVYLAGVDATLYDSTANPIAPLQFVTAFTPPAGARYYKIDLVGGYNDTDVVGIAYFDAVQTLAVELMLPRAVPSFSMTEAAANNGAFVDVRTAVIRVPFPGLPARVAVAAELKSSVDPVESWMRFRVGASYSEEFYTLSVNYVGHLFSVPSAAVAADGRVSLVMQLKSAGGTSYGRRQAATATAKADQDSL